MAGAACPSELSLQTFELFSPEYLPAELAESIFLTPLHFNEYKPDPPLFRARRLKKSPGHGLEAGPSVSV